jgi:phage shock protein A
MEDRRMKSLKRFTASILSSFESGVGQLENHEALVGVAIREAEEAAGRAKGQLSRVQRDGQVMRKRHQELQGRIEVWQNRAVRCASVDEEKAVECVRRRQRLIAQAAALEEQVVRHGTLEKQLATDLGLVQEKLVALRQQRNLLRTRQSRAEALRLLQSVDSVAMGEIDDIFDRWESKISGLEVFSELSSSQLEDDLDAHFSTTEEDAELRKVLSTLVGTAKSEKSENR